MKFMYVAACVLALLFVMGCADASGNDSATADAGAKSNAGNAAVKSFLINSLFGSIESSANAAEANHAMANNLKH